jgi:hypothetical protein
VDQVILYLIDLNAHLFIIKPLTFDSLLVLLDVLLILGNLTAIAFLVLFKSDTGVSQLAAHLIDRLASDFNAVHRGELTSQVINLGVDFKLSLRKPILLCLDMRPVAFHLRLDVDAAIVLPLAACTLDVSDAKELVL